MHVLFDESKSLVENDAQDEDFELGLSRKICYPRVKKVKIPKRDQGLDLFLRKESKVTKQAGGIAAEPCSQSKENKSEIGCRTDLQTSVGTSSETGARTAPEQCSPENRAREESVAMDSPAPRAWKHHRSHPLD